MRLIKLTVRLTHQNSSGKLEETRPSESLPRSICTSTRQVSLHTHFLTTVLLQHSQNIIVWSPNEDTLLSGCTKLLSFSFSLTFSHTHTESCRWCIQVSSEVPLTDEEQLNCIQRFCKLQNYKTNQGYKCNSLGDHATEKNKYKGITITVTNHKQQFLNKPQLSNQTKSSLTVFVVLCLSRCRNTWLGLLTAPLQLTPKS